MEFKKELTSQEVWSGDDRYLTSKGEMWITQARKQDGEVVDIWCRFTDGDGSHDEKFADVSALNEYIA